jgi:hypothetical protein
MKRLIVLPAFTLLVGVSACVGDDDTAAPTTAATTTVPPTTTIPATTTTEPHASGGDVAACRGVEDACTDATGRRIVNAAFRPRSRNPRHHRRSGAPTRFWPGARLLEIASVPHRVRDVRAAAQEGQLEPALLRRARACFRPHP